MEQNSKDGSDVDMNVSIIGFDNLTILKELENIVNLVRDDDFLETVPKAKLKRLKWIQMFNCLKQGMLDDMVQELNAMWEFEGMQQKVEALDKQKEKFSENEDNLWRPQLGDVKAQLRAHDVANLKNQKKLLESLSNEYEVRVNRLKKTVFTKREYLKAMQIDMQKYLKKNDEIVANLDERLQNHGKLIDQIQKPSDTESLNPVAS